MMDISSAILTNYNVYNYIANYHIAIYTHSDLDHGQILFDYSILKWPYSIYS